MDSIIQERFGSREGLLPSLEIEVPQGFEREEWEKLTEGYTCEEQEVDDILTQRGQAGSRRGRPTNLRVPFKGQLSSSSRAIAQRDRAALLDREGKALNNAKSADRAAKYQLTNKLKTKDEKYKSCTSEAKQQEYLDAKLEVLAEKRYKEQKSAEWLQTRLDRVHKKWENIYQEVDTRHHQRALKKVSEADKSNSDSIPQGHAVQRVYGPGGALQKIMRKAYQEGLANLINNTFESKEAKVEWQQFVDSLTPDEMAVVTDENWTQREPTPIPDLLGNQDNIVLYSDRPYVLGNDSDECEEEVDDDSEIDDYYNQMENEYETEEQWQETQADAGEADANNSESEFEGFTDFEGFSDNDEA